MKIGITFPQTEIGADPSVLRDYAQAAEELGYSHILAYDHVLGADPTNRGLAGETHVKIGHGRHYPDVPPIKGVYRGVANAKLDASVTMTRLTSADPASIARS